MESNSASTTAALGAPSVDPPTESAAEPPTETAAEAVANHDQPPAEPKIIPTVYTHSSGRSGRSSRRSSRSHRSSSHSSSSSPVVKAESSRERAKRALWAARGVALVAIVTAVILSMLLMRAKALVATRSMESGTLASELNRTQSELIQTKQLVAAQEVELGALLKQRIPGVTNLEIEKLYEINNKYLKKVSFSEAGMGEEKRLTYYAVLKNNDTVAITPMVNIMLFDRKGLQTGMARVMHDASTTPSEREQLLPGETRTYSASIDPIRKDPSNYFLIEVR